MVEMVEKSYKAVRPPKRRVHPRRNSGNILLPKSPKSLIMIISLAEPIPKTWRCFSAEFLVIMVSIPNNLPSESRTKMSQHSPSEIMPPKLPPLISERKIAGSKVLLNIGCQKLGKELRSSGASVFFCVRLNGNSEDKIWFDDFDIACAVVDHEVVCIR